MCAIICVGFVTSRFVLVLVRGATAIFVTTAFEDNAEIMIGEVEEEVDEQESVELQIAFAILNLGEGCASNEVPLALTLLLDLCCCFFEEEHEDSLFTCLS